MRSIWSPKETARSISQTKIVNFLRSIVWDHLFLFVVWLVMDTVAKWLTSVLNMTQSISKVAWNRYTKAVTYFIHTQGWFLKRSHRSKRRCWWLLGFQRIFVAPMVSRHLFRRNWKSDWCHFKNKLLQHLQYY